MPEPPHKSRSRSEPRTPKASLPGREPSHSADAVALLTQQSASSTLKARPAKLHHAAADADREDNHAPGSVSSAIMCLTPRQRLDNSISNGHSHIARLHLRLENQAGSGICAKDFCRHRSTRDFVKGFARTMQRNHVSRIDFLERLDRVSNVVLWIRREMKAPDHRMNFLHAGGGLSLLDRIDAAQQVFAIAGVQ
jgi:hypothetical protein